MDDLLMAITRGDADSDLDRVTAAVNSRRTFLASQLALGLRPGDAVRFGPMVRPQYLAGRVGSIVTVSYDRRGKATAAVKMDDGRIGRFSGGTINTPVSLLVKVNG